MPLAKNTISKFNIFGLRKVNSCPPHFKTITVPYKWNTSGDVETWIYENLSGRYYIGKTVKLDADSTLQTVILIGFENHKEATFFLLSNGNL
jgi:hypothetical protein